MSVDDSVAVDEESMSVALSGVSADPKEADIDGGRSSGTLGVLGTWRVELGKMNDSEE